MRKINTIVHTLAAGAAALSIAACTNYFEEFYQPLTKTGGAGGTSGTGGNTGGSTTGGTAGTGGTMVIEPGCIPFQATTPVRDDCGVFVSSSMGNDDNDGSQGKPLETIAKALASPKSGPIYLCAELFAESVQIGGGKTIYGGLDCTTDWHYIGGTTKTEISPSPGQVPLVLEPGIGVTIQDVVLRAQDATAPGGSSIAIIAAKDADLALARCVVEAGVAKDGAPGEAFAASAGAGMTGNSGSNACSNDSVNGGAFTNNPCDAADPNDDSLGGKGGSGDEFGGGTGSPGQPDGATNGGSGEGGMVCKNGGAGDAGAPGINGTGAQGKGTLSTEGYVGTPGNPGEKGKAGQGGGGGGGAKGGTGAGKCANALSAGGASGGAGGSGGCGGNGGNGGQAGGASIGIVSLGAKLSFNDVSITAKNGGKGGSGGAGQNPGAGGAGGPGGLKGAASALKDGCSGGPGGGGGLGGIGGGGIGGHSIAVAHTGTAPTMEGVTLAIGKAGDGGTGSGAMGQGAAGVAQNVQAF